MQYLITPYSLKTEAFAFWTDGFSDQELDWIQQRTREGTTPAQVGGGGTGVLAPDIRRSTLNWLPCDADTQWIYHRLAHIVSSLNSQYFFFDLTGFGEAIQLTNYDESDNGMYGWHVDFGSNPTSPSRKLSLVLQLSDPVDYEGGVLELQPHGKDVIKMKKQRGIITVFPSWTLHQVTPVTKGNRQTLVSWITGPAFK